MGFFDDADELLQILKDLGAETFTYNPSAGTPREVWGIVDRAQPVDVPGVQRTKQTAVTLTVVNSDTVGISSANARQGQDLVTLAVMIGEEPVNMTLGGVVRHDSGMITFALH